MPRGIYDRSKTKEQREAEKSKTGKKTAKTAAPQKRKYTKRAVAAGTSGSIAKAAKTASHNPSDLNFFLMGEVRHNLATLMQVSERFGDLPSVKSEVEAHVGLIGQLRGSLLTGSGEAETQTADEPEAEDEVQEAPNGVTAPVRQAAVPLPPPPPVAPVLPSH